ncbi:MAG: T9SS type A sorting domain-containing protein [Flavobacteriales bacterium]|nr:T9SS type A sorting domain-containing protein [Flavobacteriales bacterium]PCH87252.1 MAG: hypothetical protein COB88_05820 [Flavobacteriales bacterium]
MIISTPALDFATLNVFTIQGQLLFERILRSVACELREELDLSDAGPGLYYIQVISSKGTSVKKALIQ